MAKSTLGTTQHDSVEEAGCQTRHWGRPLPGTSQVSERRLPLGPGTWGAGWERARVSRNEGLNFVSFN